MLIVGLGNPGTRYSHTPHNVGFRVVDRLAPTTSEWRQRFDGELLVTQVDAQDSAGTSRSPVGGDIPQPGPIPIVLLKPLTFMNASGRSVRQVMAFYQIPVASTLVVHDELDLPLGAIKLKRGGGEAGHHGLESVSAELGSRDYLRLRVGVGKPAVGTVSDFLLQPLDAAAEQRLDAALSLARGAIEVLARQGVERAMNQVNRQPAVC